jgi:hypothetical protein
MDDVELLVLTFYEFAEKQRLDLANAGGMSHADEHSEEHASNVGGKKNGVKASANVGNLSSANVNGGEGGADNLDEDALVIDNDDIVQVLKEFHKKREEKANNPDNIGNPRMKKRSNFESEEQKKESLKR